MSSQPSRDGAATAATALDRMRRWSRSARPLFLVVVLAAALLALRGSWSDVRRELQLVTVWDLGGAALTFVVAMTIQYFAWLRSLQAFGATRAPHGATTLIFAVAGLGKYVPGAVWPVVIQTEMGKRVGIPRRIMLASYGLLLPLSVTTGAIVGALALTGPSSSWVPLAIAISAAACVGALVLVLHPRALHRLFDYVLRRFTGSGLEAGFRQAPAIEAALLTFAAWLVAGLHAWILCRAFGATAGDLPFVIGAFVFAWICGLVAIPLPAGLGVRDAVLVLTVGQLVGPAAATTVALLSRAIQVVLDLLLAVVTGVPSALRRARALPDAVKH